MTGLKNKSPVTHHRTMAKNNQTLGIIPVRYASTRFPGKPLAEIGGKSMIQRVYEQATKCQLLDSVVVATDDERIFQHVRTFGRVVMTSEFHTTGTDRCAEVVGMPQFIDYQLIVNIQGDEPFIQPEQIELAVSVLLNKNDAKISTLAKRIQDEVELFSPNVVKVVFGENGQVMYFSRSAIPHVRHLPEAKWLDANFFYKHIGLYVFHREVLLQISRLPPGKLEKIESLEQLRWLGHGMPIGIAVTEMETMGIDTPEDLAKANNLSGEIQ